jgi:uncharacterized protein YqeY
VSIKVQIDKDMVEAAKAKDKIKLSALRLMKAAIHNREIDAHHELSDAELLQVLSSLVKQRQDSIEQFKKGNRQDLVDKEEAELKVIKGFMPEQMSGEEIEAEISKAIAETGATGIKDMGKVMKALMPKTTGKADGKLVSELVKKRLSA